MPKYTLFQGGIALTICAGLVLPSLTQARDQVELAYDAVGVTEADFQELQVAECTVVVSESDTPLACGEVVRELMKDKIFYTGTQVIFRAEHYGEMYVVDNSKVGPLYLKRYLPNGFYESHGKYYWIADGKKQRVKKTTAYDVILTAARTQTILDESVVPISEDDYALLQFGCDFCEGHPKLAQQQALYDKLDGSIIMRAEANGELYYIENEQVSDEETNVYLQALDEINTNRKMFNFLRQEAPAVSRHLISQIPVSD